MKQITKNRFALIISMLFVIAITSCEKEEAAVGQDDLSAVTDQEFSDLLIRVTGETSGGGMTKTTLEELETWWKGADNYPANPDKVGIYSPKARTETSGGDPINNAEFTAQTSGKISAFAGEMYWGTGDHDFYAYYPYDEGNDSEWWTSLPISLASAQTQSAGGNSDHIGTLDFMVATPLEDVIPGDAGDETSGVNFQYNHVFTLLEFQVTGSGSLSKVKLSGPGTLAFGGGTIDITQGTPDAGVAYTIAGMTGETGEVTVTLTTPADLGGEHVSVYMMINPGDHSGNLAIGLEIDGDYTYMSKSPPEGGFDRGKKYVVEQLDAGDFSDGVFDIDGNEYETVIIGDQEWMAENLRTSKYNDGSPIVEVSDGETWANLTTGAYCWYNNDSTSNEIPYGKLYNWYTVETDNLCPIGWHVATNAEFSTLITNLGGSGVAGGKLKDAGTTHWSGDFGDNSSGFTALPNSRDAAGTFHPEPGKHGFIWTATSTGADNAYFVRMDGYDDDADIFGGLKQNGFYVRCIKD